MSESSRCECGHVLHHHIDDGACSWLECRCTGYRAGHPAAATEAQQAAATAEPHGEWVKKLSYDQPVASPSVPAADVRFDHEYEWPDGQIRQEPPYPCGAFRVGTNEQCALLSDHDGDHVFASEKVASPSVPGDGFDVLRELARARIYGDGALYFVEQHRAALDALLREHEERGREISTYERVEHTVHAPRYANLREALDVTYPTAEEVVGAAIAAIHERNRLRTALEAAEADTRRLDKLIACSWNGCVDIEVEAGKCRHIPLTRDSIGRNLFPVASSQGASGPPETNND